MGLPPDTGARLKRPSAHAVRALTVVAALVASLSGGVSAQGHTYAVIVVGLGGAAEYRESFHAEASQIYTALPERHGLPAEDVTYLGEKNDVDPEMISLRSPRRVGAIRHRCGRRAPSPPERRGARRSHTGGGSSR